jgi:glyoxylase-like metal-dependent hydrolase (beta-lactamase superfamily II)
MYGVKLFTLGILETNTYIVYDEETKDAVMIDPGDCNEELVKWVDREGLKLRYILATHGHIDHVYCVDSYRDVFKSEFAIHRDDVEILNYNNILAKIFGIEYRKPEPDILLETEGMYRFGSIEIHIAHTPGHTPGSIVLYIPSMNTLFSGDTLFSGSVGATHFPGGSEEKLYRSLCKIFKLYPIDAEVLPGHGPRTTLRREYTSNIFVIHVFKYYCKEIPNTLSKT